MQNPQSTLNVPAAYALHVAGLNGYYGAAQAIFNIGFTVHAHQAVSLQGPNGAGKSSTLKALMGLIHRQANTLCINGIDVTHLRVDAIANLGVGYVPEDRRIFTRLTVAENLLLAQRLAQHNVWTLESTLDALPHLKPLLERTGDQLSGGEQRMLAVGRALMRNPSLLLLDEPCEGVAPKVADAIAQALNIALKQGAGIVISESHEGFAARLNAIPLKLNAGQIVS